MSAISGEFVTWVLGRCQAEAGGVLVLGENLFDERDMDLGTKVQRALNEGLRMAAAVSVPRLDRTERRSADDTAQRCTVEVAIVRSSLSAEVDSLALAERLYLAFSGAEWEPAGGRGIGCCDVAADSLRTEVTAKSMAHSFEVSTIIIL